MSRFEIQLSKIIDNRLQILCNRLHYFKNILSQVVTFEIWNSTFKNIGNRLLLCKTIIKLFWASGNRLLPYGNRFDYQRVKTMVKDFSLKNSFGQIVLFNLFFEKFFLYLSWCFSWGSCISWVFSWIFTWIFLISFWQHQNTLGSFVSTTFAPLFLSLLLWLTNQLSEKTYMCLQISLGEHVVILLILLLIHNQT